MSEKLTFTVRKKEVGVYHNSKVKLLVSALAKGEIIDENMDLAFWGHVSEVKKLENFSGTKGQFLDIYGNVAGSKRSEHSTVICRLVIAGIGERDKFNNDEIRSFFASFIRKVNSRKIDSFAIDTDSFNLKDPEKAQACAEGLILGSYQFNDYKSKQKKNIRVKKVILLGDVNQNAVEKGRVIGLGVNLARDLGNHPPNILTPTYLAEESVKISKSKKMKSKIIDVKDFQKLGLGSFYGVAMGAAEPAKMILVEYNGGKKNDKPLL